MTNDYARSLLALQGLGDDDIVALRSGRLSAGARRWSRKASSYQRMYGALALAGAVALAAVSVLSPSIVIASFGSVAIGIEALAAIVALVAAIGMFVGAARAGGATEITTIEGLARAGERATGDSHERTLEIDGVVHGASDHPVVSAVAPGVIGGSSLRGYLAGRTLVAVEPR